MNSLSEGSFPKSPSLPHGCLFWITYWAQITKQNYEKVHHSQTSSKHLSSTSPKRKKAIPSKVLKLRTAKISFSAKITFRYVKLQYPWLSSLKNLNKSFFIDFLKEPKIRKFLDCLHKESQKIRTHNRWTFTWKKTYQMCQSMTSEKSRRHFSSASKRNRYK